MGADDFLTKPLNASELHARIIAAGRILTMQRELEEKNKFISSALEEIKKLYTSLDNDLLEARKLQQSLIRERSKRYRSFELSILLESAGRVGGDLVGFFPAGSSHLGIYAIDVSGHGINSAMMAARLAGYLSSTISDHNIALQQDENGVVGPMQPHDVVANLNNIVLNEMDTELYFTLLLAYLDLCHPEHFVLFRQDILIPLSNARMVHLIRSEKADCLLDLSSRRLTIPTATTYIPAIAF